MTNHPCRPTVAIPRSPLAARLAEAAAIQREMAALLRELEAAASGPDAAGRPVAKTGAWRHHPETWPPSQVAPSAPAPSQGADPAAPPPAAPQLPTQPRPPAT